MAAILNKETLTGVNNICTKEGTTVDGARFIKINSSNGPYYATHTNTVGETDYPFLLAGDKTLATDTFAGAVKTPTYYLPPGACTIVMEMNNSITGVRGIDCGAFSYQIKGKSSTFQIIQGSFIPYCFNNGLDVNIDATVYIYLPSNIFAGTTSFGFTPCFLTFGKKEDSEWASGANRALYNGSQPFGNPFQWNNGSPRIKIHVRTVAFDQRIYYTQILAS